ncbi:MAG TPA: SsrA-binding protein SmpB [Chitinophagales bacterium]|nr:SsrA-binding protein SmpB [Chitinophagales bacterium]
MSSKNNLTPEIKNKRSTYEYDFVDTFVAGIMLHGTEVKSIRQGKVNLADAFCFFKKNELFIRGLNISQYSHGSDNNHDPLRYRKLLLTKRELARLSAKVKERGLTVIPVKMFFNERGFCKVEIALAKGKKSFDKRDSIKDRDQKREVQRVISERGRYS